jgi:mono/diheme cytochrome c family protein
VYEVDVLTPVLPIVLASGEEAETAVTTGGYGIGSIVLVLAVAALLAWMAYLFLNSRRSRSSVDETPPPNRTQYMSDDELEQKRTTTVLGAAVVAGAVLAIIIPVYAFNEANRQAEAADHVREVALEVGAHWYTQFECSACHGPGGGGGAAAFTEARSGVETSWQAPSLNDMLFRFDRDEIRTIIEYGRQGTPMPANGLAGGGAMTLQEVDQVIDYLASLQLTQSEVVAATDTALTAALNRIDNGDEATQDLIDRQQAKMDDVLLAPDRLAATGTFDSEIADLLGGSTTCTEESAAVVETTCPEPAPDADRDGLADSVEPRFTEIAVVAHSTLTKLQGTEQVEQAVYDVAFDPENAHTNVDDQGRPVPDLDAAVTLFEAIESDLLLVRVTADRQDEFLDDLVSGMEFLQESAATEAWKVDFADVASSMSDQAGAAVSVTDAKRAVGLFNGYCARCHTGGYSAGATFETGAGSGAWGPAITDGRSISQFPLLDDQVAFIIRGSDNADSYGVNGIGTGRMPGFGTSLSLVDIELIALYERTM